MGKRPLVVLLGDSVLIESVSVRLGEKEVPGVIHLNTPSVDIHKQLGDLRPDLVVFELDSPYASPVHTLFREHPGILIVGLDLNSSRAIVLNTQMLLTPTLDALCQMVQTKASERVNLRKEGVETDTA